VSVFSYRWFPSSLYGGTIQYFKLNIAGSILIFSKNMTTDSLLVRYIFKVVIGEYWDGTKEVERGGEEAVASWADAAKGQGLRRGCAGGGRGAPDRIHMEGVA
jgi:hypothetical protein